MLEYNILKPKEVTEGKAPVIFMIHGYGSNKEDLFSFASELPQHYCIISVQASINLPWGGFAWYDINFDNTNKFTDVTQAKKSRDLISKFIDEMVEKYHLDAHNVTLLGFSQGAILSYGIAFEYPQKIKNIVALSGYILPDFVCERVKEEYKNVNVFASHGTNDNVIPVDWANKIPNVLTQKGIKYNYKEYDMEHNINPQCFEDMLQWIKEN